MIFIYLYYKKSSQAPVKYHSMRMELLQLTTDRTSWSISHKVNLTSYCPIKYYDDRHIWYQPTQQTGKCPQYSTGHGNKTRTCIFDDGAYGKTYKFVKLLTHVSESWCCCGNTPEIKISISVILWIWTQIFPIFQYNVFTNRRKCCVAHRDFSKREPEKVYHHHILNIFSTKWQSHCITQINKDCGVVPLCCVHVFV